MNRFTRTAAIAAALMLATAAQAQQDQPQQQPGQPGQPQQADQARQAGSQQGSPQMKMDKIFLKGSAIGNEFEIQLSQLAAQKAQDPKVKQFAQMLLRDHQQVKQQLQQVAQKNQVELPQQLPEMKQEELQAIQQLQGSEFDQAYLSCMKVGHAMQVAAFEEKSQHATIPEVKQFAQQTLPKLKQHKQMVVAMTGGSDEAQTAGQRQPGLQERQNQTGSQTGSPGRTGSEHDAHTPAQPGSTGGTGSGAGTGSTGQ